MVRLPTEFPVSSTHIIMGNKKIPIVRINRIQDYIGIDCKSYFVLSEVFFTYRRQPHRGYITMTGGIAYLTFAIRLEKMPVFEKKITTRKPLRVTAKTFKQKINIKGMRIGDGEGVSDHSLKEAGINVARTRKPFELEYYDYDTHISRLNILYSGDELKRKIYEFRKQWAEELEQLESIKDKTLPIPVDDATPPPPPPVKERHYPFEVYVHTHTPEIRRQTLKVEAGKRYVLVNRKELVEV